MGEIVLDAALAGLLIPDELVTASTLVAAAGGASDTTAAAADPIPGRPAFIPTNTGTSPTLGTRSPDLRPMASGSQETTQGVVVVRAGMPGEGLDVAAMRHNDDGEPVWYGWSQPHVIEHWSAEVLDKGYNGAHNAAAVETLDGRVLFVYANSGLIEARRYDPEAHAWDGAAVSVADSSLLADDDVAAPDVDPVVGVCRLRSGRLLAVTTGRYTSSGLSLLTYWSDDHGLTWRSGSYLAADETLPTTYTPDALAVGYDHVRDAVLVVVTVDYGEANDRTPGWAQYASTDAGASFKLVRWDGDDPPASGPDPQPPAIATDPRTGTLCVVSVQTSAGDTMVVQRLASPFQPLRDVDAETIQALGTASSAKVVTAWADQQGQIWAAAYSSTLGGLSLSRSLDGGASWASLTTSPYADPIGYANRLLACPCRSQTVWAIVDTTKTTRAPQILHLIESGGWQTLCQPRVAGGYPAELRAWAVTWGPWDHPQDLGWTLIGTTGTLASTGAPALTLPTATSSQHVRQPTLTLANGVTVHAEVSDIVGSLDAQEVHLRVVLDTVAVEARMSRTHIRLWDSVAGAAVGSDHAMSTNGGHRWHVRLSVQGPTARAALYVRRSDLTTWHLAATGTLSTTASATDTIAWGHGSGVGATQCRSTWHRVSYATPAGYGDHDGVTDSPASGHLLNRSWAPLPGALLPDPSARLPLFEGLTLCASGGPGLRGESWQIVPDDRYALDHVLTRSPAEGWRSADATAQRIVWAPAGTHAHHPGGRAVGLALFNANVGQAELQGWDGSAWQTVAALDLRLTGLAFTLSGDTVRVASGGTARGQLRARDLVGSTIILGTGCVRRIAGAQGGTWSHGSATATLRIEDPDGTEPTSGTATLYLQQGAAVRLGHVTGYTRWGLYLPAQTTLTDDFRIGRMVIGTFAAFGARYGRGRVEVQEVQADTYEAPGLTRARRLAPTRRRWRVTWSEGLPTRRHLTAPSYQAGGGVPLTSAGDVSVLEALTDSHGAGLGQVVYLPRVAHTVGASSPETVQCPGRDMCALTTLRGAPVTENVEGDEAGGREIVRISDVELEEEA
jgi:hypothetical protein